MYHTLPCVFNSAGIKGEVPFRVASDSDVDWLREISQGLFYRRMKQRAREQGKALTFGSSDSSNLRAKLRPGDGHDEDREDFVRWASGKLLMVDGRLLKRVHSPSFEIGWCFNLTPDLNECIPTRRCIAPTILGSQEFGYGLHFRPLDPEYESTWTEAMNEIKEYDSRTLWHFKHSAERFKTELSNTGFADRMEIRDLVSFDRAVLDSVSNVWEDMGERSVVSIADGIVKSTAPHFHKSDTKREVLEELKRLIDIVPDQRADDFSEAVGMALEALPTADAPAWEWFIKRALDQWSSREITMSQQLSSPHLCP